MAKNKVALENLAGFVSEKEDLVFIPTGHSELDYRISRGVTEKNTKTNSEDTASEEDSSVSVINGLPLGKMVSIYGGPGGGKSSIAYRVCGYAQRMGYKPAWIDAEESFSEQLANINGLDTSPDKLAIFKLRDPKQPDKVFSAETVLDNMIAMCQTGEISVIVLDSVASLVPQYTMDNPADKESMAVLPRVMSKVLPKLCGYAAKHNVMIIFINQLREDPGVMFGDPEKMPGGKALYHQSSVILKVNKRNSKSSHIRENPEDEKSEVIGANAIVRIEKNRFSPPYFESLDIPVYYRYHFPSIEDAVFNSGRNLKVISVRKGQFSWKDFKVEGRKEFMEEIRKANMLNDLIAEIKESAQSQNIPIPHEISSFEV